MNQRIYRLKKCHINSCHVIDRLLTNKNEATYKKTTLLCMLPHRSYRNRNPTAQIVDVVVDVDSRKNEIM